jgi:hypothetical protein
MRNLHKSLAHVLLCATLLVSLAAGLSGCSFIFDFTECGADQDCHSFDDPGANEYFMCSAEDKCVLEPERECRTDDHCDASQSCEQGACAD